MTYIAGFIALILLHWWQRRQGKQDKHGMMLISKKELHFFYFEKTLLLSRTTSLLSKNCFWLRRQDVCCIWYTYSKYNDFLTGNWRLRSYHDMTWSRSSYKLEIIHYVTDNKTHQVQIGSREAERNERTVHGLYE